MKSQSIACAMISLRPSMFFIGIRFLSLERVDTLTAWLDILATNSLCSLTDSGVAKKSSIPFNERAMLSALFNERPSTSAIISV